MGNTNACCPIPWDVSHGIPIGTQFPWTSLAMPAMSNPNGLMSQNVCHYLDQATHWMSCKWGSHFAWLTLILANQI